ncbi:MAG: EscU/YscU/HrcU family type III secretion system export apparatus switch protein [Treponema sp.]|jgi:flagellar biosynthesis protein|nr:EscU/YscU/HrcU family type III secretion system export apparatus switch protein [Treponema sp.]
MMKGKTASALGYDPGDGVPRLLATGRDKAAERIIETAREAGVPVVENDTLALALGSGLRPGDRIPPRCWAAAAKILAFVFAQEAGR